MWSGRCGVAGCRAAARRAFLAPRHQLRPGRGPRPAAAVSRRRIRVWARAQRDCAAAALWPQHGDTAGWLLALILLSVLCILRGLCCWRPLVRGDARPGVCSPRCSCTPLCLPATQHNVCHPVRCTESRYLDIYCGHYISPDNVTASFSWWKV